MIKRFFVVCVATVMLFCSQTAFAASLSEAKQAKIEAEANLNEVTNQIEEIEAKQSELQEQIDALDAELVQILVDIDTTKDDIEAKQKELDQATSDLQKAQADEDEHYESMKTRIQYMYENGNTTLLECLFAKDGFADALNKLDQQKALYDTDRELLEEFKETKQHVEELVEQTTQEKQDLKELEETLEEEQAQLEEEIDEKNSEADDFTQKLQEAERLAEQYQATIYEMADAIESYNQIASVSTPAKASTSASTSIASVTASVAKSKGQEVVDYASQFVGNRYVWGGTSLTSGCDCSGFVVAVYAHFGISLPHYSASLRTVGTGVSVSDMRPGDIVCYSGHVGIYAGDGLLLNASNSKPYPAGGIKYTNVYYKNIVAVRRIF